MQVGSLGGRQRERLARAADPGLDGSEQSAAPAGRVEHRREQEGRRRLAVGAGDAHHREVLARPAAEDVRERAEHGAHPSVCTCGSATPASGRSTSSAVAPRSAATVASSWPSREDPGTQAKNVPDETWSRRRERSRPRLRQAARAAREERRSPRRAWRVPRERESTGRVSRRLRSPGHPASRRAPASRRPRPRGTPAPRRRRRSSCGRAASRRARG